MLRRLLRQPATVVPAIVLVALAVGVSTGLFAYLGALLWPRVDGPRGGRIVGGRPRGRAAPAVLVPRLRAAAGAPRGPGDARRVHAARRFRRRLGADALYLGVRGQRRLLRDLRRAAFALAAARCGGRSFRRARRGRAR